MTMGGITITNELSGEKSPYLLQHSKNPVNWFPWGPAAFERAVREDKPIFLSIGYSTCHWCHVMAHESFEDADVARMMNETFVSIKVDREERPDLDSLYMKVCQDMTGGGGWPLTVVMTPEGKPFFAGTYFPKESRHGMVGMVELLPRVGELWRNRREELERSAEEIAGALAEPVRSSGEEELDEGDLDAAYKQLARAFDDKHGGFGSSPKFPAPHNLAFLLRYWKRRSDDRALEIVEKTLLSMRKGGIFDQVGYGFHRYSTDKNWLVPHFEKMLYDQALLVMVYLEAYQATGNLVFADTAREVLTYVLRDMRSTGGAFYSGEDADSEGEEGKFYVWTEGEIRSILGGDSVDILVRHFGITRGGNFEGSNIPFVGESLEDIADDLGMTRGDVSRLVEESRKRLLDVRNRRVRPFKDDKVLTDWNGLMIAALARASQVLGSEKYARAARRAADFILSEMRGQDGELLHRYREGEAAIRGMVDDYAFLVTGLIELYEATFVPMYLGEALKINRELLEHFWDEESGGFYMTPDDGEELLVRQKEAYDGAIPSGNSVAMLNLLKLGRMTGEAYLEERAQRLGSAFSNQVKSAPSGFTQMLAALDFALGPSFEIVFVGAPSDEEMHKMLRTLRGLFLPNRVVLLAPDGDRSSEIFELVEYLGDYRSTGGKATAYVCQNYVCTKPTDDVEELERILGFSLNSGHQREKKDGYEG